MYMCLDNWIIFFSFYIDKYNTFLTEWVDKLSIIDTHWFVVTLMFLCYLNNSLLFFFMNPLFLFFYYVFFFVDMLEFLTTDVGSALAISTNIKLLNGLFNLHPFFVLIVYINIYVVVGLYNIQVYYKKNFKSLNIDFLYNFIFLFYILTLWLFIALIGGTWWAFQDISWLDWWSWDPIEIINLSLLLSWLYIIHLYFKLTLFDIVSSIFVYSLVSIFLYLSFIRTGIITSLHSFLLSDFNEIFVYGIIYISLCALAFVFICKNFYNNSLFFYKSISLFLFVGYLYLFFFALIFSNKKEFIHTIFSNTMIIYYIYIYIYYYFGQFLFLILMVPLMYIEYLPYIVLSGVYFYSNRKIFFLHLFLLALVIYVVSYLKFTHHLNIGFIVGEISSFNVSINEVFFTICFFFFDSLLSLYFLLVEYVIILYKYLYTSKLNLSDSIALNITVTSFLLWGIDWFSSSYSYVYIIDNYIYYMYLTIFLYIIYFYIKKIFFFFLKKILIVLVWGMIL